MLSPGGVIIELVLKVGKMLVTGEEGKDLPGEESDKSKGLHTGKDRVYSGNTGRCGVRWSWLDYGDA